jgi:bacterial leucyl aminopeptidase
MKTWIVLSLLMPMTSFAKPVLANLNLLTAAGIPTQFSDKDLGVGYANIDAFQESLLSRFSHAAGKCGGFEAVEGLSEVDVKASLKNLSSMKIKADNSKSLLKLYSFPEKRHIAQAVSELSAQNLRTWVEWMSSYPQRYNKAKDPNVHVRALVEKLNQQISAAGLNDVTVETIDHVSTKQKSIRVTFPGTTRPSEILALGAHFDSINHWDPSKAPGADDDGSGSANLLEVFRVLLSQPRTERTLELYWYAGEESGLLGSAEIAKNYKAQNKNVIAVMQLDMTLFPGAGSGKIGLINDFTSPWLNSVITALNDTYVNATILDDECGYACSDHASWHRQGFPAATPFEATSSLMNKNLHTTKDVIDTRSDFEHSLLFSKLAMAYFLELGNSTASEARP